MILSRLPLYIPIVFGLFAGGPAAGAWYEGATLHEATVAEWQAATDENRLATAAGFTGILVGEDRLKAAGGMRAWKRLSEDLVTCLNKGTAGTSQIAQQPIADHAVMCAKLMGW